jgi:SAM-dependent methyltransferase
MSEATGATSDFYDQLAPYYDLLYSNWSEAVQKQGVALSDLLQRLGVTPGDRVLDAACGIGTQALGLAEAGYRVSASDLSAGAVRRLQTEMLSRGLRIDCRVDDLRVLSHAGTCSLAAVLACDNSVPHLLNDDDILMSFRAMHACLRPGGVVVISVRDYGRIARVPLQVRPYGVQETDGDRFLAVQVWDWDADGVRYTVRMYLTHEDAHGRCDTQVLRSRYYAVSVERLAELLRQAGFTEIQRHDDVLFQPVLTARRVRAADPATGMP